MSDAGAVMPHFKAGPDMVSDQCFGPAQSIYESAEVFKTSLCLIA